MAMDVHNFHTRMEMRFYFCSMPWRSIIADVDLLLQRYEGRPESKDRLAIKKNKQNKNKKFNVSLLQTLSYFST
jgi:hypothetical protein